MSLKLLIGLLLAGGLLACATTEPFRDAPGQPAAVAEARIKLDENGNTQVSLEVAHLAKPEKLTPPRSTYVLWAESTFGRNVLLGRLRVDDNLEARWQGSVPFDRFRLIISAEDHATPEHPTSPFVMATDFIEPDSGWL